MQVTDIVYVLCVGAILGGWLKVVRAYFANRRVLNPMLQTTKPRRRGLVALVSLALVAGATVPVFTGWASWWLLPLAFVASLVGFFFVRGSGEAEARAAGWRRSNELSILASCGTDAE